MWPVSCSIGSSVFIGVVAYIRISFLFKVEFHCLHRPHLFIHASISGHLCGLFRLFDSWIWLVGALGYRNLFESVLLILELLWVHSAVWNCPIIWSSRFTFLQTHHTSFAQWLQFSGLCGCVNTAIILHFSKTARVPPLLPFPTLWNILNYDKLVK